QLVSLFRDHQEDFLIIFSTNTSSTKVKHVRENPKVSVYYSNPETWQGVMFGGKIEIVPDVELKRAVWEDWMERYCPSGYDDPDHTILRLRPRMARGWDGQKFTTFAFKIS
ncbi:MAG: pyridoxamine 5'-phosphate oxidase family protein, partial [Candidatus Bathyarchaeota archaeon]|nr:pyridoxamine 5'-phosphate oxidase family protein [Candidatus Bathyarchaeota archaeon]